MTEKTTSTQAAAGRLSTPCSRPHRSLGPARIPDPDDCHSGAVSFVAGFVFLLIGAWPVFGFFGLDVVLIYLAFKLNYRAARLYETIDLTPARCC